MNAVIYARFSSDRQREESIEGQVRECNAYAEKNGIRVVTTYIDRAKSAAKDTDKRENFQKMIKDSAKHLFDIVLVWKLDRFARSRYDSAHFKNILRKNGVKVVSATEAITDGPEGIILESMLEGMAEYYSAELAEKVRRGMKENALKRRYNGGTIPFGYELEDRQLKPDPETAPVVLSVFQQYAEGKSLREIIDGLNQKGITTSRGSSFTYSSFKSMLKNRVYVGEFHYADTIIPDGMPAIVPQELFDRVQTRNKKNRHAPAMSKAKEKYLLTTKLFCGKCGTMMVGESGKSKTGAVHHYYKCGKAKRSQGCDKKAVKKDWIENIVVRYTVQMLQNEALLDWLTNRILEVQGEESYDLRLLQQQLSQAEKGIDNMLNAIQAGIITASTKERLTALERQKEELETAISQERISHPRLTKEQIKFFLHRFRKTDVSDPDERQRLIDCFVNAVFLYDDKIVFTFNYKDGTKTISLADLACSDLVNPGSPKILNATAFRIFTYYLFTIHFYLKRIQDFWK